ncbi:methylamine utilization protein MauJ [Rariglobus hedericola]
MKNSSQSFHLTGGASLSVMDNWLNLGVKGSAVWPDKETDVRFGGHTLHLKPATRDNDPSIHINLRGLAENEAWTLINSFLSLLAWCDDQPIQTRGYGLSGTIKPCAVGRETRMVSSSFAFPFYRNLEPSKDAQLALALYREARTVNSVPFAFLSYVKILNISWVDHMVGSGEARHRPLVEGIRETLPKLSDRTAMRRIQELHEAGNDVPTYLYESGRCAVAHANLSSEKKKPVVSPDDFSDLRRLSDDMPVVKAIAEYIIEIKMKVSRSIMG